MGLRTGLAPSRLMESCRFAFVPKDQLISYERRGARTYGKGYSGYIAIPDKSEAPKK